ncbi:MAG: DNA glycosylase [Chloroflexota bacterium]|nr:DNA glycosylase [Chloroflexota bacterium]
MILKARQPFSLKLRWLQSQAFRWDECDGWYYGFVAGAPIRVRSHDDGIEFESDVPEESLRPSVQRYFRLCQKIGQIHDALRQADDTGTMDDLIQKHGGMRVLRQDPWECLVAYICSQNKSVKGIKTIADDIAEEYGTPITIGDMPLRAFPPPQRLAAVDPKALEDLAPGLRRAERIHQVAKHITDGYLDLTALARMPHQHARAVLMSYEGIGAKIADCVSLFALDKPEAFPIDTHIAKGLGKYGEPPEFGRNAGYAGQLLFLEHYPGS